MKIAIVTPTFPPYGGGIGQVAASNARELAALGHEVTVFTPDYRPVPNEPQTSYRLVRIKPRFQYGNAAYIPKLKRYLRSFEIVHLHYPFFGGAEVVWSQQKKLKRKKIKIVLHYHMDVVGRKTLKLFFSFHKKTLLAKMIKMADRVILTSLDYGQNSDLAKYLAQSPDKFIEVPNGVDTEFFTPLPRDEALVAQYGLEPDEKIITFVGGLDQAHYFKGVDHLLAAMERLQQAPYRWRLIIVGDGDLKEYYQSLANQYRIHKRTIFAGHVPDADLPKYYNLADVSVLPSIDKSEAFGLALIEAMACAKPVVATNLAGVRSVVSDGQDGLLAQPGDADDLATKINYLLINPDQARSLGRLGLVKVRTKYGWKIIAQKLVELYTQLLS